MRADGGAACDLFITLVHGTWPRGWRSVVFAPFYGRQPSCSFPKALWFADGSEFRNRLTAALSKHGLFARISPFIWSGANSVRERDKAARELAEHIRTKQSDYPSSTQVVIAHSHGGNVALRALDKLGGTCDRIFIATIATPFVEILRTAPSPKATRRIYYMATMVASAVLPVYVTYVKYTYFPTLNQRVLLVIVGFLCLLPYLLFSRLSVRNTRKIDELVRLTSLSSPVRKHPLLILRALDDEASLTLAAAAIGNRLSRLLEWVSYIILRLLGYLTISIVVVILLVAIHSFGPWLISKRRLS